MKELTRLGTNKVFSEDQQLFGCAKAHRELAVDKFLEMLKKELLSGHIGEIDETIDFCGAKNIRVSLEAYKFSIEDVIVKKLNETGTDIDALLELGAAEVSFVKLPKRFGGMDTKMCKVSTENHGKMTFFFNGKTWRNENSIPFS